MKTITALIIKFILTFGAAWISFLIFGNVGLTFILIIAIAGTILNYLIGDLLILPRFGNIVASISDGILGAITSYAILFAYVYYTASSLAYFAIIVAILEYFFHMYLVSADIVRRKDSDTTETGKKKLNYSTEIAKEMHPSPSSYKGTGSSTTVHNSTSSDNTRDRDIDQK